MITVLMSIGVCKVYLPSQATVPEVIVFPSAVRRLGSHMQVDEGEVIGLMLLVGHCTH